MEWFSIDTLQVCPIKVPIAQIMKLTGSKGIGDTLLFVEQFVFCKIKTLLRSSNKMIFQSNIFQVFFQESKYFILQKLISVIYFRKP